MNLLAKILLEAATNNPNDATASDGFMGILMSALPIVLGNLMGVSIQLGGTSLLIVVGVALDTSRTLESYMLMRHHKGFLE